MPNLDYANGHKKKKTVTKNGTKKKLVTWVRQKNVDKWSMCVVLSAKSLGDWIWEVLLGAKTLKCFWCHRLQSVDDNELEMCADDELNWSVDRPWLQELWVKWCFRASPLCVKIIWLTIDWLTRRYNGLYQSPIGIRFLEAARFARCIGLTVVVSRRDVWLVTAAREIIQ